MIHLAQREQAQLGLKYIEDAVVDLLTRHPDGMTSTAIAEALGLDMDLEPAHRELISDAVLEALVRSGQIRWEGRTGAYLAPEGS